MADQPHESMAEHFLVAVAILASGERPARERLAEAFSHIFTHMRDADTELPETIETAYRSLERHFVGIDQDGTQGEIATSCENLWDEEVKELSEKICELFEDITRWDAVEQFKMHGDY